MEINLSVGKRQRQIISLTSISDGRACAVGSGDGYGSENVAFGVGECQGRLAIFAGFHDDDGIARNGQRDGARLEIKTMLSAIVAVG